MKKKKEQDIEETTVEEVKAPIVEEVKTVKSEKATIDFDTFFSMQLKAKKVQKHHKKALKSYMQKYVKEKTTIEEFNKVLNSY